MKILQINSVCGIRSTGRIATDIHQLLKDSGHESIIAYGQLEAKNCDRTIKIGDKKDLYLHGVKSRVLDRHGFGSERATKDFLKQVDEYKPDLIHLHNIHGYYLNIEELFAYIKKNAIPVVWTLHDCWSFTGHCVYFDFANCDRWKTQCYSCPQKKTYPASLFLDQSARNFTEKREIFNGVESLSFVTPSIWLKDLLGDSYLSSYDSYVINNGIDLETFKPRESDFRKNHNIGDKFMMLMVSSEWTKRKGLDYVLKLNETLKEDEVIVLVGLTDGLKEKLPESIVKITKTDNVQELAEIYSTANVLLNPTLEDNFPTTNLEALACGTPVITFDTGGSPEAIDKKTGIVIEQGNMGELRQAVNEIKRNSKDYYEDEAHNRALERYDRFDRYKDYIELYKKILKQK